MTERAGAPRRRSGAHSPRVTPVDMVAGSLKVLGGSAQDPPALPPLSVLKQNVSVRVEAVLLFTPGTLNPK